MYSLIEYQRAPSVVLKWRPRSGPSLSGSSTGQSKRYQVIDKFNPACGLPGFSPPPLIFSGVTMVILGTTEIIARSKICGRLIL